MPPPRAHPLPRRKMAIGRRERGTFETIQKGMEQGVVTSRRVSSSACPHSGVRYGIAETCAEAL